MTKIKTWQISIFQPGGLTQGKIKLYFYLFCELLFDACLLLMLLRMCEPHIGWCTTCLLRRGHYLHFQEVRFAFCWCVNEWVIYFLVCYFFQMFSFLGIVLWSADVSLADWFVVFVAALVLVWLYWLVLTVLVEFFWFLRIFYYVSVRVCVSISFWINHGKGSLEWKSEVMACSIYWRVVFTFLLVLSMILHTSFYIIKISDSVIYWQS